MTHLMLRLMPHSSSGTGHQHLVAPLPARRLRRLAVLRPSVVCFPRRSAWPSFLSLVPSTFTLTPAIHPSTLYYIPTHVSPQLSHISSCVFICVQASSHMCPHTCVTCPYMSIYVSSYVSHASLRVFTHLSQQIMRNIFTVAIRVFTPASLPV